MIRPALRTDPPGKPGPVPREPIDRFLDRVVVTPNGCWHYDGSHTREGYAHFPIGGKRQSFAHRFSYTFFVGEIPEGLQLDHLCRNPGCVNFAHLEPVTPRENTLRGNSPSARFATATTCVNGHPFDEHNTYFRPKGGRSCKECGRESVRRRRARSHG